MQIDVYIDTFGLTAYESKFHIKDYFFIPFQPYIQQRIEDVAIIK